MGGKPKQSQRIKGNLKAAKSSSFNSESIDTSNLSGIMPSGLLQSSLAGFGIDDSSNFSEFDSGVSENFQNVLRKMSKKDSTTKIKAMKEFIDLVNITELTDVLTCLHMFGRHYVNLSTDADARVRESAQLSLQTVVIKIGKHLATILKQIFPAWVCSQYDTAPTAASIANNSFQNAFPSKKVSDVFAFCESELLESFIKNITILNAQTICNLKTYSQEECEAKYERVVIATLRGYAMYLQKIPSEKLKKSEERNIALIGHDKFWSLHKNKSVSVRSAFFETLSILLKNTSFLLRSREERVTSVVFKSLNENDPTVLSHIWICVLLTQIHIENWWTHIDIEKFFLPKLWKTLKNATYPSIIYPNLLPLISMFNTEIMTEEQLQSFINNFFDNINYGLRNNSLAKSDLNAVATAYFEVLQYTLVHLINDAHLNNEDKTAKCNSLVDDHVIAVIFWCINCENISIAKTVFNKISVIVKFWLKNSCSSTIYRHLLDRFWKELFEVLKGSVESNIKLEQIMAGHMELIKNLNSGSTIKSVKIKTEIAEENTDDTEEKSTVIEKLQEVTIDDSLNDLVRKLCTLYVEKIDATCDVCLVESLETLIRDYQSIELFKHLAYDEESKSIFSLYDKFSGWLQNENLRCESVVEIILVLYKYLDTTEKVDLLERWIQIPSVQKNWLIMRALSYPLCCDEGITKFLKMKQVTDHLAECARQVTNGYYKDHLILLQKCFFQTENGDILIDNSTCRAIVEIISRAMDDETKINQLDQCGSFLAQIFSTVCSDLSKKDIQVKIFLCLFDFSINREISDEHISEDSMWEISTSWQDALSSGDIVMDDELLKMCAQIIYSKMNNFSMISIEIEKFENLVQLVSKLILCSNEDKQGCEKSDFINHMIEKLLKFEDQYDMYVEDLGFSIELISGEMTMEETSVSSFVNMKNFNEALDSYLKSKVFKLNVLLLLSCNIKKKMIQALNNSDNDAEDDNYELEFSEINNSMQQLLPDDETTEDYCDLNESLVKEWNGTILDMFIEVARAESILKSMIINLKVIDSKLEEWVIYLQERLKLLIENVSETIQSDIKERLIQLSCSKGEFYARSLHLLLYTKEYQKENGKIILYKESIEQTNTNSKAISSVNILQTFDSLVEKRSLSFLGDLIEKSQNFMTKVSATRSLIKNFLNVGDVNELEDRKIVDHALILLNEIIMENRDKSFLMFNTDISGENSKNVLTVATIVHFIDDCLKYFPTEIDVKRWDFVRIALSSWVLSVSKSSHSFMDEKIKVFIVGIFKLNASLQKFINLEKTRSSTEMLKNVIDEWENVFAKDVNLVLIKSFIHIVRNFDYESKHQEIFVDALCPHVEFIDFSYVWLTKKIDQTFSLSDLIEFALENLSSKNRSISVTAATIIRQLTRGLINIDQETLTQRNSDYNCSANADDDENDEQNNKWHVLETFRDTLESYEEIIKELIEDFSFKANEMDNDLKIGAEIIMPYYLLWHCILNFCSESPADLRSYYAHWISLHKYEETFLLSLFKMLPRDIVKYPETLTKLGHTLFLPLKWSDIQGKNINMEQYSAFLYMECLRHIPAIVRKWWHSSSTRQAHLIEKLTSNYVSPILCNEDLNTLTNKKEKDGRNSMQIRVLTQVREIIATYSLEEARMELLISLPQNYPLGAIKVECKKHIGGQFQAREIVKQLSIYLTHQNGRLYDGIYIWKRNLDRKFEGVEECFVCYSVLHQENLQLPRLACKTCKKKFHSTCLYRWFTSSNGSTCPLCRNIF